jgi:Xaa-Pro aminopeptidase
MSDISISKAQQACAALDEFDIDCWLIWVRETDQGGDPALRLLLEGDLVWPSALILTRDGSRTAIVGRFDAQGLPDGLFDRILPYDEDVAPLLCDELRRIDPATIAINVSRSDVGADGMTAGMRDWLHEILASTPYADRWVSSERMVNALRGRKTPSEVARIRHAVELTESIFEDVIAQLSVGQSENEIFRLFHEQVEARGVGFAWNPAHNPAVDAGPDKAFGHVGPTDRRTRPGQLLHFDFGIRRDGYCSDLQRMVFFGREDQVPDEIRRGFETVRDAILASAEALRPGVVGADVEQIARRRITDAGYDEYKNALGHQLGRNAHDGGTLLAPRWRRYGTLPDGLVEPGNVFTLEPNLSTAHYGMISLEEDVVVTERGCEFLSTPQRGLICLPG